MVLNRVGAPRTFSCPATQTIAHTVRQEWKDRQGALLHSLRVAHTQTVLSGHRWLGAVLGDCAFSISVRHKLKNALMMIATVGPLELAGLLATYASTSRTRSVSVELARHRWKAVRTG